jgi:hypothetical protein
METIKRQNIICSVCRYFFEGKELFFSGYKWSKYKTEKGAVNMLLRNYDLTFLINRVNGIVVVVKRIVQILRGRYSNKEYREHYPTNYLNGLLSQSDTL